MEQGYTLGRRPVLDGVRGLSVLLVVLGHSLGSDAGGPATAGVTTFFVLSGFLITRLLVEEQRSTGSIDLRRFYARRAWRLYPALLVLLSFCGFLAWTGAMAWAPIVVAATYTTDLAPIVGIGTGLLGHTWSLALEEQFYLLWPPLLLHVLRRRAALIAVALVAGGSALLRTLLVHDHASALVHGFRPDTRVDAILVGCLLALSMERLMWRRWLPRAAAVAAVGYAGLCTVTTWRGASVAILAMATMSALVVAWAASTPGGWSAAVLRHPFLRWTGRISYGMYLWQTPVVASARELSPTPRLLVALVGSYVLAAISWYAVERPILRLTRKPSLKTAGEVDTPSLAGAYDTH